MSYQDKYLKYKNKYLNLKKEYTLKQQMKQTQKGGKMKKNLEDIEELTATPNNLEVYGRELKLNENMYSSKMNELFVPNHSGGNNNKYISSVSVTESASQSMSQSESQSETLSESDSDSELELSMGTESSNASSLASSLGSSVLHTEQTDSSELSSLN